MHNNAVAYKRKLPEVMNDEEQAALLAQPNKKAPTGYRNYAFMTLLLNTGLRVNEAINLKIEDLDWTTGKLNVKYGKGGRFRVLWLSDQDLEKLKHWRGLLKTDSDYLFSTLKGDKLNDRYIREFIKRYASKAGIYKSIHPHILRHTFATDLLRKTKNLRLVQKALGHSSINSTMIYTHIVDSQLEEALKNLRGD